MNVLCTTVHGTHYVSDDLLVVARLTYTRRLTIGRRGGASVTPHILREKTCRGDVLIETTCAAPWAHANGGRLDRNGHVLPRRDIRLLPPSHSPEMLSRNSW